MATKKIQMLDYNIKQSENSDTLDGKHASDFASASDMTTAKSNIGELQTKVGDKSVSSQISTAIAGKADTGHTHTKSEVGLGNVDNTADAAKSVKYATSAGSAASVTGVVGIEHGGTGYPTRSGALCALINGGREFTGDLNTLTDTGVYWINLSNCTNGPASSGYGTMEVISYEVVLQRFTFYQDGIVYCRTYTNSQWYEWRKIFGTKSTVPISSGGTGNTTRDLALTALFAGGGGRTDANIVASGTYVLTTDTASNLPSESGYYLLTVFRYDTSDLACGQIAISLSNGNLYSRDYVGGNWKKWVCCSSHKIDTISIPDGADLNDEKYRQRGFYASYLSTNKISNMPIDYDAGHAFELTVTGIADSSYCTQWLKAFNSNKIWVRTQTNWQKPWTWEKWERIVLPSTSLDGLELGQSLPSTAAHGGYIDFHFNGSTKDYTTRLIETSQGTLGVNGNIDVTGWVQCSNGLWIANGGLYASNNNSNVYGTSLPSAGTKGRIYFKKA